MGAQKMEISEEEQRQRGMGRITRMWERNKDTRETRSTLYSDIYWRGKGTVYNRILSHLSRSPIFHQLSYSFFSTAFLANPCLPFPPVPHSFHYPHCVVLLIKQSVCSQGRQRRKRVAQSASKYFIKNSWLKALYFGSIILRLRCHKHINPPPRDKTSNASSSFHFPAVS